ncbi:glycoside hydrolase family 5 protein [Altererythrobacter lauratis]|uniref:Glycoside hydrolase family 5 protein n=1 Tax=Alteraurantiacibacter lauratis TaxID=2054627 RepID=A0ABV7EKK8_9SPHN
MGAGAGHLPGRAIGRASMAALVMALAACGGSGSSATPTPPPVATPAPTPAPMPTPTPPAVLVPSALSQDDARIGACINMANMLEPPREGDWGRAINDTDFADIAAKGFETVRLPVRWSNHASYSPPYTIDPAFMARVVEVVGQARAAGLRVILNVHHYDDPGGSIFSDPAGQTARLAGLWKQIATQFRNEPDDMVWFELLNEPHNNLTHANLLSVLGPSLAEVRATNPTRPVVIGGENWSGVATLDTLPLPNDAYIIATIHSYDPFNFTHQGASWVNPSPPMGATFGSPADLNALQAHLQIVQNFTARTGRPVFLGEYGAIDGIPMAERAEYYRTMRVAYEGINVDACAWGYTNSFAIRDQTTGAWHEDLVAALGL